MSSVVPDKVSPEIGWRAWHFDGKELTSLTNHTRWEPGSALQAICHTRSPLMHLWLHASHRYEWRVIPRAEAAMGHNLDAQELAWTRKIRKGEIHPRPRTVLPSGLMYWYCMVPPEPEPAHGQVPSEHCSCGIYARTDPAGAYEHVSLGGSLTVVLGTVKLWGKVIPGTQGWRAEYAYPDSLYVQVRKGRWWHRSNLHALEQFAVPVHTVADIAEVEYP